MTHRYKIGLRSLFVSAAAALLVIRVAPYLPAYREYRFASMPLQGMLSLRGGNMDDPIYLYHLGRKLNRQGDYAAADPALERAAGLDPDSARIRDEWAQALMGHGRLSVAFGILRQYMGTHPRSPEAPYLLGKFYITREDWEPARRALETAVDRAPANADAWLLLARAQIKMGAYGAARDSLQRAVALSADKAEAHLQLAALLEGTESATARKEYARAVELAPRDAVAHRQFGRFLLNHNDATAAEAQAQSALALAPNDPFALELQGRCLAAQNRWPEAAQALEAACRAAPFDPEPARLLARAYRYAGRLDQAQSWERRYSRLIRSQEAVMQLTDATQAHPKDAGLHHRLALLLSRTGDVSGCLREEAFAARTPPDNPRALSAAAADLDRAGYVRAALPLARQAARQRQNPAAQEALGNVLLHMGRLHEAAVLFNQIQDWNPNKRSLYRQEIALAASRQNRSQAPAERLFRAAQRERDARHAITLLNQAVSLDPENTHCLRALMKLQLATGDASAAATTAVRLIGLSPEDGVAHSYFVAARLIQLSGGRLTRAEDLELSGHLAAAEWDSTAAPLLLYDRGVIELKRGRPAEAAADLDHARQLDPRAPAVYAKLAEARQALGDIAGARRTLEELHNQLAYRTQGGAR